MNTGFSYWEAHEIAWYEFIGPFPSPRYRLSKWEVLYIQRRNWYQSFVDLLDEYFKSTKALSVERHSIVIVFNVIVHYATVEGLCVNELIENKVIVKDVSEFVDEQLSRLIEGQQPCQCENSNFV